MSHDSSAISVDGIVHFLHERDNEIFNRAMRVLGYSLHVVSITREEFGPESSFDIPDGDRTTHRQRRSFTAYLHMPFPHRNPSQCASLQRYRLDGTSEACTITDLTTGTSEELQETTSLIRRICEIIDGILKDFTGFHVN